MDPVSITTGTLTIIAYCVQIAQWINNLKGVDERIAAFLSEIKALSATHDALHKSLQEPAMLAAARNAEQNAGSELWKQIGRSINDCRDTMAQLHMVLREIDGNSNRLVRKPLKMFRESLMSGQVATLRQRINFFNSTLALPLQMMNVTLQIEQQEITAEQNQRLDDQINCLMRMTNRLTTQLNGHIPLGDTSQRPATDEETLVYERLETCLETARKFCSNASAVSSIKSGASTITPFGVRAGNAAHSRSIAGDPLSVDRRRGIEDWIPPESKHSDDDLLSGSPVSTEITSMTSGSNRLTRGSLMEMEDNDLEFEMTQKFLQMGQKKLESGDYAGAEKSFLKALSKLESHDLKDKIALDPAEVQLLLGTSYLKQNKFDSAEALLLPLTRETESTDILQVSSASYLLGQLYLQKAEHDGRVREDVLDTAVRFAMAAYKGRRQQLGKSSSRCTECARLLVLVYTAKQDDDEVEVWQGIAGPSAERPLSDLFSDPVDKVSNSLPVVGISQHDAGPVAELKKPKSRTLFGRTSSGSIPIPQRQKPVEPTSPLLASGASSIRSTETKADSLYPLLPAASLGDTAPRRSSSWFSNKSKSPSPSKDDGPSRPRPQPLAIYADAHLVTREQAAAVKFRQIQELCSRGDQKKAAKMATLFLAAYIESGEVPFEKEIVRNIREGGNLGLAATGHGYAALHFFASLPNECAFEVGLLIKQGVDVNATEAFSASDHRQVHYRAIQLAVERGHVDVVKEFLAAPGINIEVIDEAGRTPVFVAFDKGFFKMAEMLLNQGAMSIVPRTNGGSWDLLAKAVASAVPEIVRCLLEPGVPLSVRTSEIPILILAVRSLDLQDERLQRKHTYRTEGVKLLLDAGADAHEEDQTGHTAMYYAALEGCTDIVEILEAKREETIRTMPNPPSQNPHSQSGIAVSARLAPKV